MYMKHIQQTLVQTLGQPYMWEAPVGRKNDVMGPNWAAGLEFDTHALTQLCHTT